MVLVLVLVLASCLATAEPQPELAPIIATVSLSNAIDMWTTSHAIEAGGRELNPLGSTVEKRVALHLAAAGLTTWGLYESEKHWKWAKALKWAYLAANIGIGVRNLQQAQAQAQAQQMGRARGLR